MLVKDMFEKNGHNPSCGFAGDIVSYLYDEIDTAEKAKFETHLANCATCGVELAAFSNVRTSVTDWREADFGWLPAPDIFIPYERVEEPRMAAAQTRGTILTDLKRLFSFTPWPPAFAAFGALAIFVGLAVFAVSYVSKPGDDLADNSKKSQPAAAPTADPKPAPTGEVAVTTPQPKGADTVVSPEKNPAPTAVKVSTTTNTPRSGNASSNKDPGNNKPANKNSSTEKKQAPNLNNYTEEEDKTLRLADLFEEIDTME
jgi:hypothetical protein